VAACPAGRANVPWWHACAHVLLSLGRSAKLPGFIALQEMAATKQLRGDALALSNQIIEELAA
jgi:hypothetical protein